MRNVSLTLSKGNVTSTIAICSSISPFLQNDLIKVCIFCLTSYCICLWWKVAPLQSWVLYAVCGLLRPLQFTEGPQQHRVVLLCNAPHCSHMWSFSTIGTMKVYTKHYHAVRNDSFSCTVMVLFVFLLEILKSSGEWSVSLKAWGLFGFAATLIAFVTCSMMAEPLSTNKEENCQNHIFFFFFSKLLVGMVFP